MKRILFLVLILVLCTSLFCVIGCNDKGNEQKDETVSETFVVTCVSEKTTTQEVKKGEKAVKPSESPKKAGYVFVDWYLGRSVYDWNTPVTENITIEAKFREGDFIPSWHNAYQDENGYIAASDDTLIVIKDKDFSEGCLNATITPNIANDCGVIFGLDNDAIATGTYFWEEQEYYVALLNSEGFFILAKVGEAGRKWREIANSDILVDGYSASATYSFEIYYKNEVCLIKINGRLIFVGEIGEMAGTKLGYRSAKNGTAFGFTAVSSDTAPIDEAIVKEGDFFVKNGDMSVSPKGVITTLQKNTIGVFADGHLENGELSATITKNSNNVANPTVPVPSDDGIIFCLNDNGKINFWEDGVSYYFFFISQMNTAYLGKVDNGTWTALLVGNVVYAKNEYVLKVEIIGNYIQCYVDGEMVFACADGNKLNGTKVGFRTGEEATSIKTFDFTETAIDVLPIEGYTTVNGGYQTVGDRIQAMDGRSIAVKDDAELTSGTFGAKVTANGDNGLIFGLDDNGLNEFMEEGVSYWFFYINDAGRPVLGKIENGEDYCNVKESNLSAMYSKVKEYSLKVVLSDGYAYCYVDDNLHIKYEIGLFGNKIALRGDAGAQFTDVSLTDSTELITADTLIFGHSYTEYWKPRYKTDFSETLFGDILDIGIGGTQTTDWSNLIDEVATYDFDTAIFMIGINDFGWWNPDVTAQGVADEIIKTIDGIHELLPSAKIALININRVPLAEKVSYYTKIDETNTLLEAYANTNDYVELVDFASAVLESDGETFKDYFHLDQLHLNSTGYDVLTNLVKQALGIS